MAAWSGQPLRQRSYCVTTCESLAQPSLSAQPIRMQSYMSSPRVTIATTAAASVARVSSSAATLPVAAASVDARFHSTSTVAVAVAPPAPSSASAVRQASTPAGPSLNGSWTFRGGSLQLPPTTMRQRSTLDISSKGLSDSVNRRSSAPSCDPSAPFVAPSVAAASSACSLRATSPRVPGWSASHSPIIVGAFDDSHRRQIFWPPGANMRSFSLTLPPRSTASVPPRPTPQGISSSPVIAKDVLAEVPWIREHVAEDAQEDLKGSEHNIDSSTEDGPDDGGGFFSSATTSIDGLSTAGSASGNVGSKGLGRGARFATGPSVVTRRLNKLGAKNEDDGHVATGAPGVAASPEDDGVPDGSFVILPRNDTADNQRLRLGRRKGSDSQNSGGTDAPSTPHAGQRRPPSGTPKAAASRLEMRLAACKSPRSRGEYSKSGDSFVPMSPRTPMSCRGQQRRRSLDKRPNRDPKSPRENFDHRSSPSSPPKTPRHRQRSSPSASAPLSLSPSVVALCSPRRKRPASPRPGSPSSVAPTLRRLCAGRLSDDEEFTLAEELFFESMPRENVDALQVRSVGQEHLRQRFLETVRADGRSGWPRVRVAWHLPGTMGASQAIMENGICCDEEHCACGRYGRGGYVALSAAKANAYADSAGEGGARQLFMVLALPDADVVLGERGVRPAKTAADLPANPTEFCFVDAARLYCVFLLSYVWVPTGRREKVATAAPRVSHVVPPGFRTAMCGTPKSHGRVRDDVNS
eukprot:TRINITY_DN22386_c0_g1_i1.p1 TRINITY_DN22386_c0_g1~~TRINITY_DN22386_c0_g1_i1.p1  ORF type:complete len:783 (+),score=109.83 TRINITY_DN22386_c0_g1_i1:97-2349(+)